MWVEFNLVGRNFQLNCRSFGINEYRNSFMFFTLLFITVWSLNRFHLKTSPTSQWSFSPPKHTHVPTTPHTLLLSKFKSIWKAFQSHIQVMSEELACHTYTSLLGGNVGTEVQYFQFVVSKYVQHAALLYQVNMCTGEDEAWAHRKQSNGNQKDFLFQSSPIFICRGFPIISLITSHTSESILELFCCTFLYLFCRSEQSQALKDHLDWDHTTENRWTRVLLKQLVLETTVTEEYQDKCCHYC